MFMVCFDVLKGPGVGQEAFILVNGSRSGLYYGRKMPGLLFECVGV